MIYSMLTGSGLQMGEKKHRWICSARRHSQGYSLSRYEYKILQRTYQYSPHPQDSQAHYRRWSNTYKPRDKTTKQIDAFRAAERKARAILSSRRISLNRTADRHRVCWGFIPKDYGSNDFQDDPCDNHPMNCPVPPQDPRRSEVQEDRRVAQGATSTWTSERPPSLFFPPPPPCEEAMERPNPEDDQSPQSPDGQAYDKSQSHGKEDGPQPQEEPQYEDISMDEEEDELPEGQQGAQALPVAPQRGHGNKGQPSSICPSITKVHKGQ